MKKKDLVEIERFLAKRMREDWEISKKTVDWKNFQGFRDVDSISFNTGRRYGGRKLAKKITRHVKGDEVSWMERPAVPEFTINSAASEIYSIYQDICYKRSNYHCYGGTFKDDIYILAYGSIDIYARTSDRSHKKCNVFARVLTIKAKDKTGEKTWISAPIMLETNGVPEGTARKKAQVYLFFFAKLYLAIQYVFIRRPEIFKVIDVRKECKTIEDAGERKRETVVIRTILFDEHEYAKLTGW